MLTAPGPALNPSLELFFPLQKQYLASVMGKIITVIKRLENENYITSTLYLTLLIIDLDLCSSVPCNALNVAVPFFFFFYTIKLAILNYPYHSWRKGKRN